MLCNAARMTNESILPNSSDGRFCLRRTAGWLFAGLLSGYLIFNRPFAQLGFSPFYIGEIVLAICLLSVFKDRTAIFYERARSTWAFRFIAVLIIYGAA